MTQTFSENQIKEEIKLMDKEFEAEWETGYLKRQQEKRQPEERNKAIERLEQKQGQPKPKKSRSDKVKDFFYPVFWVVVIVLVFFWFSQDNSGVGDSVCQNLQAIQPNKNADLIVFFPPLFDKVKEFDGLGPLDLQSRSAWATVSTCANETCSILYDVQCQIPGRLCEENFCYQIVVPFTVNYQEWKDWSKDKELIYKRGE